jgi:hypothetical protein
LVLPVFAKNGGYLFLHNPSQKVIALRLEKAQMIHKK